MQGHILSMGGAALHSRDWRRCCSLLQARANKETYPYKEAARKEGKLIVF